MRLNIWIVLVLSALAMAPSLFNGWTSLDDGDLTFDNPNVTSFNIKNIWLKSSTAVYVPLTTSMMAVEYQLVKDNPMLYHLDNILLHLLVTWLVWYFVGMLRFPPAVSLFAALIFGVHPMHVESVAWATERKDVLYSVLYLCALIMYTDYAKIQGHWVNWPVTMRIRMARAKWWYCYAALILSLFAKPMALSFPLVALLMDWYVGRVDRWRTRIAEKIPFFLAAVIIAGVTFYDVTITNAGNRIPELEDRILYWIASCMFYPLKFFVPFKMSPVYVFPDHVNLANQYYQLNTTAMVMWVYALWIWRWHRAWIFANGFYILSAFFLWRTNANDFHNVADRFMYLPSIGYCILAALAIDWMNAHLLLRLRYRIGRLLVVGVVAYMISASMGLCRSWNSGYAMYKRALRVNPDNVWIRERLADEYRKANDFHQEMDIANEAIKLEPENVYWIMRRAQIWGDLGDNSRSYIDMARVVHLYEYYSWDPDKYYFACKRGMAELQSQFDQKAGRTKVIAGAL